MKYVTITITPNPVNVILPNNYTYTTVITEELPTSYGIGVTSRLALDSLAYDMSQNYTMDRSYLTFDSNQIKMSQTNVTMDTN
jgi:hypothetical protein